MFTRLTTSPFGRSALGAVLAQRNFATYSKGKKIGFIGLGNMGGHMAHNLMKNGHSLVVYDISPASLQTVSSYAQKLNLPITIASSPSEVATHVDTIITMLPTPKHVRDVYAEMFPKLMKEALLIDSSTVDPATSRDVAEQASKYGATLVDAPVSGGVGGAEAGTLTFMVGGTDKAFDDVKVVLQMMGKNIVHCGATGTGQVAKVANNLVLGISMVAVSEGMNLGIKLGMDPKKLASIFNTSSGRCWSSDTYNPCPGVMEKVPASRNYEGGFGVDLMKKDMNLALSAASSISQPLPLGELATKIYQQVSDEGNGKKDFGIVYQYLKEGKKL